MADIVEAPVSVADYQRLRLAVGWWPVDDRIVAASLPQSLCSLVVEDQSTVVGCARLIGDPMYLYVQDMIVLPDYQRCGLGATMLRRLMKFAEEYSGQGGCVGLMCARGAEAFYARFGFQRRPADGPGMQRILKAGSD